MCGLTTAMRTLTRIPTPGQDSAELAEALPFFPLVGALLGALLTLAAWGLTVVCEWPAGAAAVAVALGAWLTRGLHLDGLADAADALGGGRTRERRLEIMKDPHVGAFGVVALVCVLLLKWVAIARLAAGWQWPWLVVPLISSRTVMVELAVALPYARTGNGTAAPFVRGAARHHAIIALLLASVGVVALVGPAGLMLLALALGAGLWLARLFHARFGGITGDLLGMTNEVTETGLLLLLSAAAPWLPTLGWAALLH